MLTILLVWILLIPILQTLMSNIKKKRGSSSDPLQDILMLCGQLSKSQIKQLLEYLPQLLADWEEAEQQLHTPQQLPTTPGGTTPSGRKRGTYIEWKTIKRNGKAYGPYPYWRYRDSKVYKSVYLKELAQANKS